MKGTWQTTSGSSGTGAAVAVAAIVAAAIARPVLAAAAELVRLVLITGAALAGLAAAGGAALVVYRVRHRRPGTPLPVHRGRPVTWQAAEPLPAPQRPAIEAPREVHIHVHGASAEDIAEALQRLPRGE
jgi:hypothetical protein